MLQSENRNWIVNPCYNRQTCTCHGRFSHFYKFSIKTHFYASLVKSTSFLLPSSKKDPADTHKLIICTKFLSQASHLVGCLRVRMWDFKFSCNKFPAKSHFEALSKWTASLHDKIPLNVSLQTGAAIKFRECSSVSSQILQLKVTSATQPTLSSCSTNLKKHFITNFIAKRTFGHMTACVLLHGRIYKLFITTIQLKGLFPVCLKHVKS